MTLDVAQSKFESFRAYPLFSCVGQPLPPVVAEVGNWRDAAKFASSKKWERCCLMARNLLQRSVEVLDSKRIVDWNSVADKLRPEITLFADRKISEMNVSPEIARAIKPQLSWDMMMICLEFSHRDIVDPPFYCKHLDAWYREGHFPCGWDGEPFPDRWNGDTSAGRLIVF